MTRLPPALRPLWPAARVAHRRAARVGRQLGRLSTPSTSVRATPRIGCSTAAQTAAAEPEHVRIHELTAGRSLTRELPVGHPCPMAFWEEVNQRPSDHRFVLEVAGGRLFGEFAALVTPDGRLDVETSPYWGRDWRENPIFLRPRLPRPSHESGVVVSLASAGSTRNYYHSVLDALPRWGLAREVLGAAAPDAIVVGHTSSWDRQFVSMLGLDRHRLIQPGANIVADRLLVPAMGNRDGLVPPWITDWLRTALPPVATAGRARRIYVTRGSQPRTRRFVAETELVAHLATRGFEVFDPGAHSVQEQIDAFAAAEVVVGPHGAGLTNLNFSPAGVRVLELFAPHYLNPTYWAITSNVPDSRYRYLVAEPAQTDRPARKMLGVQNDIDIPVARVLEALDDLLSD